MPTPPVRARSVAQFTPARARQTRGKTSSTRSKASEKQSSVCVVAVFGPVAVAVDQELDPAVIGEAPDLRSGRRASAVAGRHFPDAAERVVMVVRDPVGAFYAQGLLRVAVGRQSAPVGQAAPVPGVGGIILHPLHRAEHTADSIVALIDHPVDGAVARKNRPDGAVIAVVHRRLPLVFVEARPP